LSVNIRRKRAINELIIGFFILLFGTVWLLHQAGLIQEASWIWPFAFIYFGALIVIGAIYRLGHGARQDVENRM
jgi:hypothetical protein